MNHKVNCLHQKIEITANACASGCGDWRVLHFYVFFMNKLKTESANFSFCVYYVLSKDLYILRVFYV